MAVKLERAASEAYAVVTRDGQLDELCARLRAAGTIALDLETTGFIAGPRQIVGWVFSTQPNTASYIPVGHVGADAVTQPDYDEVLHLLKPILEDESKKIVIHNAKFDTRFLRADGVLIDPERIDDTQLEAFVCQDVDQLRQFGLKYLEYKVWGVPAKEFTDLFRRGDKVKNIATVPIDSASDYALPDADFCLRLHERYRPVIQSSKGRTFIYGLESKLWPIVQQLEDRGVRADPQFLGRTAAYLNAEAEKLRGIIMQQIRTEAATHIPDFNLNSPQQLGAVLFDVLHLPSQMETKGGRRSTSRLALELLSKHSSVCRNVLTYRSMTDNATSLRETLIGAVGGDGRIHTQYNQTGATSGRFSSTNPNLQNVSRKKEWTIEIDFQKSYTIETRPRNGFVAEPDYYLIEFDFSAIEFIIMAALAGEQSIVDAYLRGDDVHVQTAALVLAKPEQSVTKDERQRAKTWNYLIIYGGSGGALSLRTGQSRDSADAEINRFYTVRPKLLRFAQRIRAEAIQTKTVETAYGRVQYVPEFDGETAQERSKAERACVNRKVQGTAADMQKMGIVRAVKGVAKQYTFEQARLILQTHDSHTWEVHRSIPPSEIIPLVEALMPTPDRRFPLIRIEHQIGVAWGTLRPYDPSQPWDAVYESMVAERQAMVDAIPDAACERQFVPLSPPPGPCRLNIQLERAFTSRSIAEFRTLLDAFPGSNILTIIDMDGNRHTLANRPTSLGEHDLRAALRGILPDAVVSVDRESMIESVAGAFA